MTKAIFTFTPGSPMDLTSYLTQQLPYLAPLLLLYLISAIVALLQLKRCGRAAAFAMIGCGLLCLMLAVFTLIQGQMVVEMQQRERTPESFRQWSMILGIIRTAIHVIAFSMVMVGVFIGRRPQASASISLESEDHDLRPHRGTVVFVLGILSLLVFAPLGLVAWYMGSKDLAAMRAGTMDRSGQGLTSAGQILGVIGTVLLGIGVLLGILWAVMMFAMMPAR